MPFNYNPGITDHSGELMAMGIYRAGDALGQSMQSIGQDIGQARNEAKAADALYKAMMPADGMDGSKSPHPIMPKDKWDSLGWNDKRSTMAGVIKSIGIQQVQEETKRRNQQLAAELEQQNRMNAQNDAFGGAMNRLAIGSSLDKMRTMGGAPMPDAPTREQLLAAVMSNPLAAQSRGGQAMILQAMQDQGNGQSDFFTRDEANQPLPAGFARIVTGPRASQVVVTDPTANMGKLPQVEGLVALPTGKGNFDWKQVPGAQTLSPNQKLIALSNMLKGTFNEAERQQIQAEINAILKGAGGANGGSGKGTNSITAGKYKVSW